jgi:hypothetical protein
VTGPEAGEKGVDAAIDARYRQDLTLAEMGEPMQGRTLELGPASPALILAGIPNGRIFMRKETALAKPRQNEHPYPRFLLRKLPNALRDPILVHESWTQPGTMVALLDVKHEGRNFVAALHFKTNRDGAEITEIASFYPREAGKIMSAIQRTIAGQNGSLTYYHKEKTRGWLAISSGSNSPQLWFQRLGSVKGIPTDADVVKPEGGSRMMASPTPQGSLDFGATGSMGDKNQIGLNFDGLTNPPNTPTDNMRRAYEKATTEKARESIATSIAKAEGLKDPQKFIKAAIGGQGSFDFGTDASFETKQQLGFDFTGKPAQATPPEAKAPAAPAAAPATLTYDQFKKSYGDAFQAMNRYTPEEVGSGHYAEKMAELADAYPEHMAKLDAEQDGIPANVAPAAPASPAVGRFRPKTLVEFKRPITGPSGAKLAAYEWKYRLEDTVDKRGEDAAVRVSNWEESQTNDATGREVVHQFHVETPDGKSQVVSLETAIELLGYTTKNASGSTNVKSLASVVKTRARNQMELGPLEAELEAYEQWKKSYDQAYARVDMAKMPRMTSTYDGSTRTWKRGDYEDSRFGVWMRDPKPEDVTRIAQETATGWKEAEAMKVAGKSPSSTRDLQSKITDLKRRIKKADAKIEEITKQAAEAQPAVKAETPTDNLIEQAQAEFEAELPGRMQAAETKLRATSPNGFTMQDAVRALNPTEAGVIIPRMLEAGIIAKVSKDAPMMDQPGYDGYAWTNPNTEIIQPDRLAIQTLPGVTEATVRDELKKGQNNGNFGLVTASKVRLAFFTGDPKTIEDTILEEMGIRAPVTRDGNDIMLSVITNQSMAALMRTLRGSFNVLAAMNQQGQQAIRVLGVPRNNTTPEPNTPDFRLLPPEDKKEIVKAKAKAKTAEKAGITDFGSKLGGARKDQSIKTGESPRQKKTSDKPGWFNRYEVAETVAEMKPNTPLESFLARAQGIGASESEVGRFVIYDKRKTDWKGQNERATRQSFATREEAEAFIPIIEVSRNHRVRGEKVEGTGATPAELNAHMMAVKQERDMPGYLPYSIIQRAGERLADGSITQEQHDRIVAENTPLLEGFQPLAKPDVKEAQYRYGIWRDVTDRKRVQVVKQTFDTEQEAREFMVKNAADIIETKTSWREELIVKPENAVRKGAERRKGPATPEMFQEAFGFRGVEFGNWMRQAGDGKERQEVLNHAYDGLLDLAELVGIPPKAISLNGELGLAFGARGQGLSGAKAHYEPDYVVINLTKMSGAGSLAHEWIHALDHYFGRQDGRASSQWVKNNAGDMVLKPGGPEKSMVSHGFSRDSKVREEVRNAFVRLMDTVMTKAVEYVEDSNNAEKFVAASRKALEEHIQRMRKEYTRTPDERYEKRPQAGHRGPACRVRLHRGSPRQRPGSCHRVARYR